MKYCLNCGAEIADNRKYCSNRCQCDHQQKVYIEKWHNKEVAGLSENGQLSANVRHYLLTKAQKKCERCGWGETNPFTGQIPLEIHHKNGDHANSFEENLEVLCPNCHALTENFRSRGGGRENRKKYYLTNTCQDCGKTITSSSTRCVECEQKHRKEVYISNIPISREELKARIRTESFVSIAKSFNMSDNGFKRWISAYDLPNTKKLISQYSDEEWEAL